VSRPEPLLDVPGPGTSNRLADGALFMSIIDSAFSRISSWVCSSDIAINWYSLSREAIVVHLDLLCWLHTARSLLISTFLNSSLTDTPSVNVQIVTPGLADKVNFRPFK